MRCVIHGTPPSKSNSYRIANNRLFKTKVVTQYEDTFKMQCGQYRGKMIEGRFELILDVYLPSDRQDLDGVFKVILDCMQSSKVVANDRKCIRIVAQKFIDKVNPRIEFEITEL